MTKGESSLEEKRDEIYESFHVLFPYGDSVDFRKKVKVFASKSHCQPKDYTRPEQSPIERGRSATGQL